MNNKEPNNKKTILLVEDDPLIIRVYQKRLIDEGYKVIAAFNGEEAVAQLTREKPDLILLDLMMPKMNGVEALKAFKKNEETKNIPVIILTNLEDRGEELEKAKKLGAVDYLVKSEIKLSDLSKKVREVVGPHE